MINQLLSVAPLLSPDREVLRKIYDEVVLVDVLDSGDTAHLSLMKRPELGITFTKLHCWNLTQYSKCVFMDADTLVSAASRPFISSQRGEDDQPISTSYNGQD